MAICAEQGHEDAMLTIRDSDTVKIKRVAQIFKKVREEMGIKLPDNGENVRFTGTQSKVHGGKTHTNPMTFAPSPGGTGSAAMFGPQAVYFAELFGPRLRYSGFAFARELGSIIAGGPAPLIAGLLVAQAAGAPWGVCLYVIVLSLITAFAVWCGPETYRSDIRQDDVQDR